MERVSSRAVSSLLRVPSERTGSNRERWHQQIRCSECPSETSWGNGGSRTSQLSLLSRGELAMAMLPASPSHSATFTAWLNSDSIWWEWPALLLFSRAQCCLDLTRLLSFFSVTEWGPLCGPISHTRGGWLTPDINTLGSEVGEPTPLPVPASQ